MNTPACKVAVLASGYGSNFRAIAEACSSGRCHARVVCLITDNPEAHAIEFARAAGIAAHVVDPGSPKASLRTEVEDQIVAVCESHGTDLVALAGFMRILKGPLLRRYAGRIMNIHPSLLPSFKGLHAVRQAIDYGVKVTGCTVHFVDESVDGGPIILQGSVDVGNDTEEDVLKRMHEQEHRIYVRAIDLFSRGCLEIEGRRVWIRE